MVHKLLSSDTSLAAPRLLYESFFIGPYSTVVVLQNQEYTLHTRMP